MILTLAKVDSLPGKPRQITGDQHGGPVVLTNPKLGFRELRPWQIMSLQMSVHQGRVILVYYRSPEEGKSGGKVPEWHFSFHIRAAVWSAAVWMEPCDSSAVPLSIPPASHEGLGSELTQISRTGTLQWIKNLREKPLIFPSNQVFSFFSRHLFLSHSAATAGKWHIRSNRRERYSKPVY